MTDENTIAADLAPTAGEAVRQPSPTDSSSAPPIPPTSDGSPSVPPVVEPAVATVHLQAGGPPCPVAGCKGIMQALRVTAGRPQSRCTLCGLEVDELVFRPVSQETQRAELALTQDAVCAFHPDKKAVNTCAGTGNFICALCSVPLRDSTYSVQFLESSAGKAVIGGNFDRFLNRPDRAVITPLLLYIAFPLAGFIWFTAILWFPYGLFQWFAARRQWKTDALFRTQCGSVRLWTILVVFLLLGGASLLSSVGMIWYLVSTGIGGPT